MPKSNSAARACSPRLGARAWGLVAILLLLASPCSAALTGADKLAAVYDAILSAQFDRADAGITTACPPAPMEACRVLEAISTWWRIQIDPDNRSRDQLLNDRARTARKAAEAWT